MSRLWNKAVEAMPHTQLRDLQLTRLRAQVAYNFANSPFFKDKFATAGMRPDDVASFADFARLPLMTKAELRTAQAESLERFGNPYALLACAPPEKIVRINATSGTTGVPTLYTLTAKDVATVNEMHARKYWRAGIRPGNVLLQALSLSMFTGGLPLSQGIQHMGACVVPVGVEGGIQRVLDFINLSRPQALIATPSFGQYLIEECPKISGREAADLGLAWFFCAGEPGGSDPAIRAALANGFDARVFDHTGGGHAFHGISCEADDEPLAMHMTSEDHCLLEIVDPVTREPLTVNDGAVGEMLWTFLDWEGGPLMRFATGDVARVWLSPCSCGMPGLRFQIIGRADDMLIVRGVNVYPAAVNAVIARFMPRVTGHFRIALPKPGPLVEGDLVIRIEHGKGLTENEVAALEVDLRRSFRSEARINPAFRWEPPFSLPRVAMKAHLLEIAS